MLNPSQKLGKRGESQAARQLKKQGYKIIQQNYRSRLGEIDIIAKDKKTLVFVEVKARSSSGYGHPKSAVTHAKQRKISITALGYLKETGQTRAKARFDVVTVLGAGPNPQIEVVKNAFELAYP
jgi:putative endonuclease